jgi:sigma-E factor negative regulatory protein RseC
MIETPARVVRVDGDTAWVRAESPTSCGACGGKGCGSSLYARMLHPREPEYPVANLIAARPGEAVIVGVADGAVLRAVWHGYLLPLLLLLLGAMLGATWGDGWAVAGGVAGLALATLWLRRRRQLVRPAIVRLGGEICPNA